MPEDENGDTGQPATGQGDTDQFATGQGDTGQPAPGQESPVPYSRFKEKVDEVNKLKQRADTAEQQFANLQQQINLSQVNRPQTQEATHSKDIFEESGLTDEDYPTVGQLRKAQNQTMSNIMGIMGTQMFMANHPDFKEIVGEIDPSAPGGFRAASPLTEVLKRNPTLLSAIARSPDGLLIAYELAKTEVNKAKTDSTKDQQLTAQEKLLNKTRIGSASSTGGATGINAAQRYANMPKKDFDKLVAEVKAGRHKKGV